MQTVSESEAQAQLPDLVEQVQGGAQITITKDGEPVARLVPIADRSADLHEALESARALRQQLTSSVVDLRSVMDPGRRD